MGADRLKMIIDSLNGPVQFSHDGLGSLTAAAYPEDKVDLRMPDAVANLFRSNERHDRKYGPAGQLQESWSAQGTPRYAYDPEGNLAKKTIPDGSEWTYESNAAGMLAKVTRPDGQEVTFGNDPLGRRVWEKYRDETTSCRGCSTQAWRNTLTGSRPEPAGISGMVWHGDISEFRRGVVPAEAPAFSAGGVGQGGQGVP